MAMFPRFQAENGAPAFIGESGQCFPSSVDGTIMAGTRLRRLNNGEEWYYDGEEWKLIEDQKLTELRAIRRLLEQLVELEQRRQQS